MAKRGSRNNVLAGALVLGSLLGAVVVIVMIAGGIDYVGRRSYIVEFTLSDGVTGLKQGSEVRLGGMAIGAVSSVKLERPEGDQPFERALVKISIDRSIPLRQGAVADLKLPLLGDKSALNFASSGSGAPLDPDTQRVPGRIAPPAFLSQAGYGPEQKSQVQSIIGNISEAAERIKSVAKDFEGEPYQRFKEILKVAEAYLKDNQEDFREGIKKARTTMEGADKFVKRLNEELGDKAAKLLEDGGAALASARDTMEDINALVKEQRPGIRATLANLRLSSEQLRSTLLEVRRSPWRLLYRPDMRELEFELLYDSARSYADAVTNLRQATESLESVLQAKDPRLAADGQTLDELVKALEASRARYQDAEQRFLELIGQKQSER